MVGHVVVVGAGPAGLMAAEVAASGGAAVTVLERMASPARKFLMAGRGGLNLTHSEPLEVFLSRYGAGRDWLEPAIRAFPPDAVRAWCAGLGVETFVGSSGRVFPVGMKASPLLRAWLRRLDGLGVRLRQRAAVVALAEGGVAVAGEGAVAAEAVVLALGGASWPRLGADGGWVSWFAEGEVAPLRPANGGFRVDWSAHMGRWAGAPLKRIALGFGGRVVRGEAVVTAAGIEGGAVYALSGALRDAVEAEGSAVVSVDLRPDLDAAEVARRLGRERRGELLGNFLRKAVGLDGVAVALVQEARHGGFAGDLAELVKGVPVRLVGTMGLGRAISTAGGVRRGAVDERFMLRSRPGVFVAGEILDWEAPTGGYLLQGCFATGRAAGASALEWIRSK